VYIHVSRRSFKAFNAQIDFTKVWEISLQKIRVNTLYTKNRRKPVEKYEQQRKDGEQRTGIVYTDTNMFLLFSLNLRGLQ
jgi:hypothetical protein